MADRPYLTVELEDKGEPDSEKKKRAIAERGLQESDRAYYKTHGGKAWIENDELIVETDAFHALRKPQPANKAESTPPIPNQGKGF